MSNIDLISLDCPKCGGEMEVSATEKSAVCPYCGHTVLINKKDYARIAYEHHLGKEQAEAEIREKEEQRKKKASLKKRLIAAACVTAAVLIGLLGNQSSRRLLFPETADPYKALDVQFSGVSGEGRLKMTNNNRGELGSVTFTASAKENLSNGDVIEIQARRMTGWKWTPATKEYVVSGLTQAVAAISELPAEVLDQIRDSSEALLDRSWREVSASGKAVTYEIRPYAVFLLTGNDSLGAQSSILLDTFETAVTREDGTQITFWQAVRYPDVMMKGDGSIAIDYSAARLLAWKQGYNYGFDVTSAVYGWQTRTEMEAEISSYQDYSLVDQSASD